MEIRREYFIDKEQMARIRKGSHESIMLHTPGTDYIEQHREGLEKVEIILRHSRKQNRRLKNQ